MGFKCGIVGLPNVGKSTLFNALTGAASAEAANYPFCTIEPNVARVSVPDKRLNTLADIANSAVILPTQIEFVDIAGLVRGASKGEGLGNQFLSHIREVDAIVHVVRCFEGGDITHVEGSIDPIRDSEIIETELILADISSLEKRVTGLDKKVRSGDKEAKEQIALIERILPLLNDGKPARVAEIDLEEERAFKLLQLLTAKPLMYVCNVAEGEAANGNDISAAMQKKAAEEGAQCVIISAQIEEEISSLESEEERQEFLQSIDLDETGLSKVISTGYDLLKLITFFTIGPKEARAWTIRRKTCAPQAAGVIHTDFEKGFIRAETISYADYVEAKGEQGSKEAGKMRLEGKEYVVSDGDVMHMRFAPTS